MREFEPLTEADDPEFLHEPKPSLVPTGLDAVAMMHEAMGRLIAQLQSEEVPPDGRPTLELLGETFFEYFTALNDCVEANGVDMLKIIGAAERQAWIEYFADHEGS